MTAPRLGSEASSLLAYAWELSWAPNSGQGPAKISYGGGGAGKGLRVK